jgi:hypothetical protein
MDGAEQRPIRLLSGFLNWACATEAKRQAEAKSLKRTG